MRVCLLSDPAVLFYRPQSRPDFSVTIHRHRNHCLFFKVHLQERFACKSATCSWLKANTNVCRENVFEDMSPSVSEYTFFGGEYSINVVPAFDFRFLGGRS